jgi:hypothetical protein
MSSITYWSRLEPDPRSPSIAKSLSAQIRDPLWMLTRQWQFGEFRGEDAGSPAYTQLLATQSSFVGYQVEGQPLLTFNTPAPLEKLAEQEPFSAADFSLQVELGQTFEALLVQAEADDLDDLIDDYRAAYRLPVNPDEKNPEVSRFLRICGGRAIAGGDLYLAAKAAAPLLPDKPVISDPEKRMKAEKAIRNFLAWVKEVFGELGAEDPPAWKPERLEYGIEALAVSPAGNLITFAAEPGRSGELDWRAFDLQPEAPPGAPGLPAPVTLSPFNALPTQVRFRGMPNARWWDFENGGMNFGAVTADRTDLAKLIALDFMLVHGNDWLVIPYDLPVGSLCRIDALLVRDVFGGLTLVERADAAATLPGERWTMFSTAVKGNPPALADFFVLPPSAFAAQQSGVRLEEVRFIRDEMANMVWAIEHTIENEIGEPQPGHERVVALEPAVPPNSLPVPDDRPPLRYQIQTSVPANWIPFLPVRINTETGDIALERAAMLDQSEPPKPIRPQGRILLPTAPSASPYRVREEEAPHEGVHVSRIVQRVRWIDGSTHLWIAREKCVGKGEGSSGLRFDLAIPNL